MFVMNISTLFSIQYDLPKCVVVVLKKLLIMRNNTNIHFIYLFKTLIKISQSVAQLFELRLIAIIVLKKLIL